MYIPSDRTKWPLCLAAAAAVLMLGLSDAHAWRSALYPDNWQPGWTDGEGRFLHDFSYAGYHRGETPIPDNPAGPVVDVTQAPYGVDSSGTTDVTAALQQAIDDVGAAGGGVVYLPAGTYRISPQGTAAYALYLGHHSVVLRGAGPGQTFLFNDETNMRMKQVVLAGPDPSGQFAWYHAPTDPRTVTEDLTAPTVTITVDDASGFAAGDWIVVRADPTNEFIADHDMTGEWLPQQLAGPIFYRRIESVDSVANRITIDVPLRYSLLTRDSARINRVIPHLEEIGVEGLSIGMRQHDGAGTGDDDYAVAGTAAYEMHASHGLVFNHVVNGWIRNVHTYRPATNSSNVHVLSGGIRLYSSRFITVEDVELSDPQYKGNGGNGYLIVMTGQENLVTHARAVRARHNLSFGLMKTSGNVVHDSYFSGGRLPVDFHMHLSMANLLDNVAVENESMEAVHRLCCGHGHSTTQTVFWNSEGLSYPSDQWFVFFIIDSVQFGHGYIIGTRGPASQVLTANLDDPALPADWVEGVGQGDTLEPGSLYLSQLAQRLGLGGAGGAGTGGLGPGGSTGQGGGGLGQGGGNPGGAGVGGTAAGGTAGSPSASEDSGCGCRLGARGTGGALGLLALLAAYGLRRRPRAGVRGPASRRC